MEIFTGGTGGVIRVNATTGATATFIANGSGGLGLAAGVDFGPDGHLYVADQTNNVVRRYDGASGAYIDDYAVGVAGPAYTDFTPDQRVAVTYANQSPTIATNTGATVDEGSTANIITTAMLDEGDPDDDGAGLTYTITANVTHGTLKLSGAAIGLNDTFSQDDIDNNRLTYDHDGSETTSDSFGFSLADGGENGSTPATGTFTLTVTPVNDAPTITSSGTVNAAENQTVVGTVTATDADGDTPTFSLTGGADQGLFAIDTNTGALSFVVAPDFEVRTDANTDGVYVVQVTAADGNGGSTNQLVNVTVTDTNDAPVLVPYAPTYNTTEGAGAFAATVAMLLQSSVSDADTGAVEGIAIFGINSAVGTFEYTTDGSTWISVGTVSSNSALLLRATDSLRFTPTGDVGGQMTINYRAWDQSSGTAGSKVDASTTGGTSAFSTASDVVTVNVTGINDAPAGTDKSININENAIYTFTTADFGFTDVDGNNLDSVWFMSVPANGALKFNGATFAANNYVVASDIVDGLLTFQPATNATGTPYTSFTFQVQDDGGTANGGLNRDATSNTITINVANINNAPVIDSGGLSLPAVILPGDSPSGKLVGDVLTDVNWSDADVGALKGIAIVAKSGAGTWQYSTSVAVPGPISAVCRRPRRCC
ncbi:MAG: cadherin domain-containing protein [Gammaproteobacteria bacterium]|nr:cadherin domain-containing protein [Gammaproteobacteria bacterium]